jgi:hypothetical protein
MPLAPLESPFRAFPSRGAVPALAGLVLPCGFAFDRPTARHGPRDSRLLSPARRPFRHGEHEARRTAKAGTYGSLESLGAARLRVATRVRDVSSRIGRARRTRRPARPLRSFAPLESPFLLPTACPGQGAVDRPLLSWAFFPSRACSSSPWVRCARGRSSTGQARSHRVLESPAPGHAYSPGSSSGRGV